MIIKENVTLYKCEFCAKESKTKHTMIKHEKICNNNPENFKKCMDGCIYLSQKEIDLEFEGYDGEYYTQRKNVFHCNKFEKLMYPFSIERKNLPDRFPTTYELQQPMPKDCNQFDTNVIDWPF